MIFISRFLFSLLIMLFICFIGYFTFIPLYNSEHVIIDYGIHPFDICIEQPIIWKYCKSWFIFTYIYSSFFFSNMFFNLFFKKKQKSLNKHTKKISNNKKFRCKKSRISHSLIDPKPPNEELQLLIRRK